MAELFDDLPEPRAESRGRTEPEPEPGPDAPLAERMRPRSLAELVGQEELVGPGRLLAALLDTAAREKRLQSLVLWGPPGSGKTTLARLIARASGMRFVPYSAVLSGIKEIREVMSGAAEHRRRSGARTLLFVDEIHRFNKAQQDAFLPFVERGDVVLVGATTENPSFELNSALLSRVRVVILRTLSVDELVAILERALADPERGLGGSVAVAREGLERIAHAADGDARRALTLLESAALLAGPGGSVDEALLTRALLRKVLRHDKAGEQHYDLISALYKSVRNSDASAALYWLARLLEGGEDPRFVARSLVRMASEDVGLADPGALRVALDAAEAWERLGDPWGKLALAQAVAYLARAPKSNALYVAYRRASADVQQTSAEPVPLHLRNAPTGLMRAAGYGAGYRYVHDDPSAREQMTCLPPGLEGRDYFAAESASEAGPDEEDDAR